MSLGEGGSDYVRNRDDRTKVRDCTFNTAYSNTNTKHCLTCIDHPRLMIKEIDGQKKWWCRGCGNSELVEPGSTENTNSKYQSKYGSTKPSSSFIISKDKKKEKRPGELSDEDRSDLAGFFGGSSGEGATLVSEHTTYTDEQGSRY
jgi:hypothetical protein